MPHRLLVLTKKDDIKKAVKDYFTEYLTLHDQRKTPERFAILNKIYSIKGHFDFDTLHNLMKDDFMVSRATIYNTLELLIDSKLVLKHNFYNSDSVQYEKTVNNIHHHMICTECGTIKEFTDENIKKIIRSKPLNGFQVSHFTTYVYGTCNKCSKLLKKRAVDKTK